MTPEVWKPVVGYEDIYAVSDLGRIKSLERIVRGPCGQPLLRKERLRSLRPARQGYVRVALMDGAGGRVEVPLHRLVLEAFIGPAPEGRPQVNHKDFNKSNNLPANLEWVSPLENSAHARAGGRLHLLLGIKKSKVHSREIVAQARALADESRYSTSEISTMTGIPRGTLSKILSGSTWSMPGQVSVGRGRSAAHAHGKSRGLTLEGAREIRRLGATTRMTQRDLATMFGISQSSAGDVLLGRSWKE